MCSVLRVKNAISFNIVKEKKNLSKIVSLSLIFSQV